MKQTLQNIFDIIQQSEKLDVEQKEKLLKAVKVADKELEITAFKLERTEKVKKTTAILLEETIEELEQKRKAVEDQNRELEIEASLERVRSAVLEMKKQDDLMDVVKALLKELNQLGFSGIRNAQIDILDEEKKTYLNYLHSDYGVSGITENSYDNSPFHKKFIDDVKSSPDALFFMEIKGKDLDEWREQRKKTISLDDPILEKIRALYFYSYSIGSGAVGVSTFEPIDNSKLEIIKKFRNVFFLSYQRFRDIELAEKQAREAEIQLALERVRARTMAMQHSDELAETAELFFKQFCELGLLKDKARTYFSLFDTDIDTALVWITQSDGSVRPGSLSVPLKDSPQVAKVYEGWKQSEPVIVSDMTGKNLAEYLDFLSKLPHVKKDEAIQRLISYPPNRIVLSEATFRHGTVGIMSEDTLNQEAQNTLIRFAKVFEQTYTRFLDLQKAEAQAREAQIEAALEKVRARAMAMHSSEDLSAAINVFFKELKLLGLVPRRCGVAIINGITHTAYNMLTTATSQGDSFEITGEANLDSHPLLTNVLNNWKDQKEYFPVLKGDEIKEYYRVLKPQVAVTDFEDAAQFGYYIPFNEGMFYVWADKNLEEEKLRICRKFTSVIGLTYRRFLDLKEAEARAFEAVRQSSLDRVRAEIASMRTSEDLNRITPIIWRELKTLEVPFIRCGVFIIDEELAKTRVYLTTPDGKSLGVLNLAFDTNDLTKNTVEHWRKEKVYKEHWNKEQFINWTKSMMELDQVQNAEIYQGSSAPPESLNLHFVPFTQGMLYVGDASPLTDEKLELVKTLAEAFSIAYARYEDFKNIEDAKNKIELTLTELKSTQAQLVHSEKMASLGELTAGIAHEIKNPLNFVNNFSEISSELIDEVKEELEKNDKEEVLAILEDLKQNLEKINQHGKRADSIVKGMLLHSRGTSGEKTSTDINDLLDQYVNLAYHGIRAQNKEFNITIEKDFDETLEKISVVPQDISRVFLNIINNACYAAYDKKKKSGDNNFSPTLKVSTKQLNGKVEIRIGDNGNGIPNDIIDKIFQPFFTTKPTGEGTGLGLSLSYDIVTKVHGGELKVNTIYAEESGKKESGSTFIISLPC